VVEKGGRESWGLGPKGLGGKGRRTRQGFEKVRCFLVKSETNKPGHSQREGASLGFLVKKRTKEYKKSWRGVLN